MKALRMAVTGFVAITACSRSAPERGTEASRTPDTYHEAAAARQGLVPLSAVPQSGPASPPASARASAGRPAPRSQGSESVIVDTSPYATAERDTGITTDTMGYRAYSGADGARSAGPGRANAVVVGTVIHVSLRDSIDSKRDSSGKEISGMVMQNVTGPGGEVLVRAGSPVMLTISRLRPGRGSGQGAIEVHPDSITLEGRMRKLEATIASVPYELRGRGVTGEDAAKVGIGTVGGAVVGRVITGKTKGAVVGGVVGAAGGAVVASQTAAKDVVVGARTPVEMVLTAPLVVR